MNWINMAYSMKYIFVLKFCLYPGLRDFVKTDPMSLSQSVRLCPNRVVRQ